MCPTRKLRHVVPHLSLALVLFVSFFASTSRANVYATNIKLNGSLTNATGFQGGPVTITYILNEPATMGVTVDILSAGNPIRSIAIPFGNAGTLLGLNSISWDGKDTNGSFVPLGTYGVSITASASGFPTWTQTSTDTNDGYYVFSPRGIAVNNNSNSPYYGRVFIGNAENNNGGSLPGDKDGILKANADGSLADEGQSTGGYNWIDDGFEDSPHFLRYGQDDRIYALDLTGTGIIVALDMTMSTNQLVLSTQNYANNPFDGSLFAGWGNFDVTDAGTTNGRLWLGDNDSPGAGLWTWHMVNGVADPNDHTGTQAIAVGGDLSVAASGGSMTDSHSNIFIGQDIVPGDDDTAARAMVFTNWTGQTLTNGTAWKAGASDDNFLGNYDLAIDSRTTPKYVALALSVSGGLRVLNATNGFVVTNDTQVLTNLDVDDSYFGVAWDAVGNLYGAINNPDINNKWRVFSPPGTNQATTIALATVQLTTAPIPPNITSISITGTTVTIVFTGAAGVSPGVFTLQSSGTISGGYANVSGANIIQTPTAGVYQATTTTSGSMQFYRIAQ